MKKLTARVAAVVAISFAAWTVSASQQTAAVYQSAVAEQLLAKGRITATKDLAEGITRAQRITLELDGVTNFAVFKTIDESKQGVTQLAGGTAEIDFQDSWQTEVAAYHIDKIIGLGLVPATVERRVGQKVGSAQYWVESAMTEADRVKNRVSPPDLEAWNQLMFKVRLFDQLIANVDRHLKNMLVTTDFDVRLIDHSRSFRTNRELKKPEDLTRFSQALLDGIKKLEQKDLRSKVGRWLTAAQIQRLLQRRDAILELAKKHVAARGAEAVIFR